MKRKLKTLLFAMLFGATILYGLWGWHLEHARSLRQARYEAVFRSYEKALSPQVTRGAIEKSLQMQRLQFLQLCCENGAYSDRIKIGQEPAPWYCNREDVYVELQFNGTRNASPASSDVLRKMRLIHNLGQCL